MQLDLRNSFVWSGTLSLPQFSAVLCTDVLVSDGTNEESGFRAAITSETPVCGSHTVLNATTDSQIITSPGKDYYLLHILNPIIIDTIIILGNDYLKKILI